MVTCIGNGRGRVLRDRHLESCTASDCVGCEPCPAPHCLHCGKAHAPVTCPTCLAVIRNHLHTTEALAGRLELEAVAGRAAHAVGTGIPGGDALVLASPGATQHGARGQLAHRVANHLDTSHTLDEARTDPRPVAALLLRWEDTWRERLHQPTDLSPTVERSVAYLDDQLHRLAQDALVVLMAHDLEVCVRQLEDVLHDGDRPEVTRVPCWECGARLVKVYAEEAKDDHWRCPRCGERYDRGRFDRAKHDHLASRGAERYVSVADAVGALGVKERTLRSWVQRGLVDAVRDPSSKRLVVWWPHVRAQHQAGKERAEG